jgi:hypothetical protein
LTDITNQKINTDEDSKDAARNQQRQRRERGPPADGIPSKTKVMVANLPYDLTEEKVGPCRFPWMMGSANTKTACRAFQGLPALVCQDRAPPHSPFHD